MADVADLAQDNEERILRNALSKRQKEARKDYIGQCYYCGDDVEFPRR